MNAREQVMAKLMRDQDPQQRARERQALQQRGRIAEQEL